MATAFGCIWIQSAADHMITICVFDLLVTASAMSRSLVPYRLQTSEDLYEVVLARLDAVRRRQPFDAAALRTAFTQASATLQASKQNDCSAQMAASSC